MSALDFIISQRDEKEYAKVRSRMFIAAKIADALKAQGLNQKDFALRLGKKPSEISKWLTGTHNFTHDTLFDIQTVLNINLLNVDKPAPVDIIKNTPLEIKYEQKDKKLPMYPTRFNIITSLYLRTTEKHNVNTNFFS